MLFPVIRGNLVPVQTEGAHALTGLTCLFRELCRNPFDSKEASALSVSMEFAVLCVIESKQMSNKFVTERDLKSTDLRVVLKSHKSVIIQSKHLGCPDSRAAVNGCQLIMNSDSSVLGIMAHLFKHLLTFAEL